MFLSQRATKRRDEESHLRYGYQKILSEDVPNKQDAAQTLEDIDAKVFILNRCIQEYKAINIIEGKNVFDLTKEKVSGVLEVTVMEVMGVPTKNRKRLITVRVDNMKQIDVRLKTKLTIPLTNAQDFEICFSEQGSSITAFQFFPLADFTADVFKKNDHQSSKFEKSVTINLLPIGQCHLLLSYSNNFLQGQGKSVQESKLERQKAVQKIHIRIGHKFATVNSYQILKCAVCNEFIIGNVQQCYTCHLACHSKCLDNVIPKCITKLASEIEPDDISTRHNIPHKFTRISKLRVQWCCHCGKFLPLKGFNIMECSICHSVAHHDCIPYVPNLCSLPKEMFAALREHNSSPKAVRSSLVKSHRHSTNNSFTVDVKLDKGSKDSLLVNDNEKKPSVKSKLSKTSTGVGGLDDFEFLAVLGKGNFGKVMLAQDKLTKLYYGIKVLKKDFILDHDEVESTRSEKNVFLIVNRESHPFLVNLHSCFQTEQRLFFVMELISGGDLMYHIQQQKFTLSQSKFYACEVLLALQYLHQYNILYRDLKLDNILMTVEGHVKIADYGLCKERMGFGQHTRTFCGTPEFMAPEILEERPYTRAVDWWSFGVLLYEMILGKVDFFNRLRSMGIMKI